MKAAWLSFGLDEASAQAEYRTFVLGKIGCTERLWDKITNAIYLGTEDWTGAKDRRAEAAVLRASEDPARRRPPDTHRIIGTIARQSNVSHTVVRSREGGPLRLLAAWIGWNEGWLTLASIAAALRLRSEGSMTNLIARCEELLGKDSLLLARLDDALAALRT